MFADFYRASFYGSVNKYPRNISLWTNFLPTIFCIKVIYAFPYWNIHIKLIGVISLLQSLPWLYYFSLIYMVLNFYFKLKFSIYLLLKTSPNRCLYRSLGSAASSRTDYLCAQWSVWSSYSGLSSLKASTRWSLLLVGVRPATRPSSSGKFSDGRSDRKVLRW